MRRKRGRGRVDMFVLYNVQMPRRYEYEDQKEVHDTDADVLV